MYFPGSNSTVSNQHYDKVLSYTTTRDAPHASVWYPALSRQSACHHPLVHDAPYNRRHQTRSEECDEAHLIYSVPLELLLTYGHFSVLSMWTSPDDATWRKCSASFALGASSISIKLDTSTTYHSVVVHMVYVTPILVRPSHREVPTPHEPVDSGILLVPWCLPGWASLTGTLELTVHDEGIKQDVGMVS